MMSGYLGLLEIEPKERSSVGGWVSREQHWHKNTFSTRRL